MPSFVKFRVLFFLLIIVAASGCTAGKTGKGSSVNTGETENTAVNGTAETIRQPVGEKKKLVFGSVKKTADKVVTTPSPVTDLDPGDYATLLVSIASPGVFPSDMKIGELQDYGALDQDKKVFFDNLKKFFADAFKGTPDEELINPSVRDAVVLVLKKIIVAEDISVRIGRFRDMDGYLDIPVRLFSGDGRTEGDISAELVNGSWMISSLSLNPEELNKPYKKKESEFEPDSYPNLRLEY